MKWLTSIPRNSSRPPECAADLRANEMANEVAEFVTADGLSGRTTWARIPGATYRLQFTRDFTLRHATALLDYLQALGITDVYASPLFQAGPDSSHGYDVCCSGRISDCLGGAEAFEEFTRELQGRDMGLLLDIVPNHMGATARNAWWWDVLKHGASSPWARFFDIDWERGGGRIVLPVLGEELETVLAAGQLRLSNGEEPELHYFDKRFPINPATRLTGATVTPEWLDRQHYKLIHWRRGPDEINYRRFFEVNDLVALRMEDSEVFAETHRFAFELLRRGQVQGLRVDHPDGLRDPAQYFERLQSGATSSGRIYVVAEKILSPHEPLPADWPVAGTTGYDFLNDVNGLFVASANESAITELNRAFTGSTGAGDDAEYRAKKLVLGQSFPADVRALAERLARVAKMEAEPLRVALVELIASFPVYRTYIRERARELSAPDAEVLQSAFRAARPRAPALSREFDQLEDILFLRWKNVSVSASDAMEFIARFQQLTGPAAAKGIEDTAFYRCHRLISINEVGSDLAQFGITVAEFHQRNLARARSWPHSLLATATHDTKRGEDARARINVLSELPQEWRDAVMRWHQLNARHRTLQNGTPAPDANDEYLFYQALIGSWDAPVSGGDRGARFERYMLKAIKEAKRQTSWIAPNETYEQATKVFVASVLVDGEFLREFLPFQRRVAFFGVFNSLAQTLLKLAAPGVPDLYQGTELWDFSLVDPDNRRPVDFGLRREILERGSRDGVAAKIFLVARALQFRQRHRPLFDAGGYLPLGANALHLCSFARWTEREHCVVVAPRLACTLMRGEERAPAGKAAWGDAVLSLEELPGRASAYRNVFTGEVIEVRAGALRLSAVLREFPVALLEPA